MQVQTGQSSIQPLSPSGLACPKKHKVGYQEKYPNTTNQASPSCPVTISNNAVPRLEADEINHLAKTWCEMILGFIQERNRLTQVQGAIQE